MEPKQRRPEEPELLPYFPSGILGQFPHQIIDVCTVAIIQYSMNLIESGNRVFPVMKLSMCHS